ncbi:hypothetical protein NDU88_001190 [Pleurodeles waltl]|uniref:Uncharacterized protein n=1 Tax=Pleurodeles waltl TaxID=8319 RepID=A0AAV7MKT7_PLEWA|nr:hypothetical protein NDU88_001190 [Pleurodeles waltl]
MSQAWFPIVTGARISTELDVARGHYSDSLSRGQTSTSSQLRWLRGRGLKNKEDVKRQQQEAAGKMRKMEDKTRKAEGEARRAEEVVRKMDEEAKKEEDEARRMEKKARRSRKRTRKTKTERETIRRSRPRSRRNVATPDTCHELGKGETTKRNKSGEHYWFSSLFSFLSTRTLKTTGRTK